jgi:hypothetical protein
MAKPITRESLKTAILEIIVAVILLTGTAYVAGLCLALAG